ncbi:unnamed protein product [Bursaphelenchus okinawaensis]|uniref:Uncharacterized protein n=1 Tax=Bursaphelenchus okinawaensis TaxID=465554 RepID=A0A811LS05_9BILA|nr:unnamed protein product [Bursaphelenchus okinawaensis]CAG9127761.1 unnamed protein product [Bursaphelenchus okinawaensis]
MCNQTAANEVAAVATTSTPKDSRKGVAKTFEEQLKAADIELPKKKVKKANTAPLSADEVLKAVKQTEGQKVAQQTQPSIEAEEDYNPLARRANQKTRVYSGRPKALSVEDAVPVNKYQGWNSDKLEKKWQASSAERPELEKAFKALAKNEFKVEERIEKARTWRQFYMKLRQDREAAG